MLRRAFVCAVWLALLLFTLLGLVGIFVALGPAEPSKPEDSGPPDSTPTGLVTPGHRLERELCVVVDGQRLRARFELQVGSDEKLVSALWRGGGPSGAELVSALFGTVSAAQFKEWPGRKPVREELTFRPPRLATVRGGTARILTDSDPYTIGTRRSWFFVASPSQEQATGDPRTVTVDAPDGEVTVTATNAKLSETVAYARTPETSETKLGCRASLRAGVTRHAYLLDNPPNGDDRWNASFTVDRERTVAFWTSDIAEDTIPALDPFLWVSMGAFPYGLAAWYLRRSRLRGAEATSITLCVFWPLVAAGVLWTVRNIDWTDLPRPVTEQFSSSLTRRSGTTEAEPPQDLVIYSLVLVGALAWPLVCWALHRPTSNPIRPTPNSWPHRAGTAVPYLVTAAAAAAAAAMIGNGSPAPWAEAATISVAAALGAIVATCLTILVSLAGAPALSVWGVTALGATAVGATAISPFAFTTLDRGSPFLARLSYLFALVCLAAGGAILLVRSLREWVPQRRRIVGVGAALTIYLLLTGVLVLPRTVAFVNQEMSEVRPWSVLPFVDDLSALLYVIVLISVIAALRCLDDRCAGIGSAWLQRSLGVVFVVLNFYWYNDRWLYLPVPVLLGWVLAAWWLLPRKQVRLVRWARRKRAAPGTSPTGGDERLLELSHEEGERLLELSRAERRHHDLLRAGAKSDLDAAREHLNRVRQEVAQPAMPPLQQRFFAIPDGASPWRFGVRGAILGAWLGIPWMVVFLVVLARDGFDFGVVEADRYPAVWMFSLLFGTLTQWSLYGFFLGYFFPYLRGNNAVAKALAVFATLAVPSLVQAALWWREDWIQPTLWWALQALVFFVLLGMLMDYHIARSAGVDRDAYIEIRGLTTLLGWSGAVVAATVTAAITLVQSTAALYVQNWLRISSGGPTGP